jgi:hypothetical protein
LASNSPTQEIIQMKKEIVIPIFEEYFG